MIDDLAV